MNERQAFEAWWAAEPDSFPIEYESHEKDAAWQAWQARASAPSQSADDQTHE